MSRLVFLLFSVTVVRECVYVSSQELTNVSGTRFQNLVSVVVVFTIKTMWKWFFCPQCELYLRFMLFHSCLDFGLCIVATVIERTIFCSSRCCILVNDLLVLGRDAGLGQCIYFYIFVRACRGHMLLVALHV